MTIWFRLPAPSTLSYLLRGLLFGFSLTVSSTSIYLYFIGRKCPRRASARPEILSGVVGLIGDTPLVRINSLSDALRVEILGKAEFLNPGGSVKDRVALRMIQDAEREGLLKPHSGSRIFEGTVGSTGISIATIARARGYDATIIMPDNVASEKVIALQALGAEVVMVRPASIVDKKQYVNLARQYAANFGERDQDVDGAIRSSFPVGTDSSVVVSTKAAVASNAAPPEGTIPNGPRGFFADQFENRSNYDAHFDGTGPEIWRQVNGEVAAFVSGAGTGGTIAGVGNFLKSVNRDVIVALADPEGSGLYKKVKYGVMFDQREAEGTRRRHQVDTVVEGIGLNRLTKNIELALPIIDDAFRVTDAEAISMSRYIADHDGLFLGSSSACNLVACVKLVQKMGWSKGQKVVTILCDSGSRHYSKFWNSEYLQQTNIPVDLTIVENLIQGSMSVEVQSRC